MGKRNKNEILHHAQPIERVQKNKPLYFEDMNQAFFENLVVYMINKKKNKQSNDNDKNDENEYRYSNFIYIEVYQRP
jgi:hypothetical protein